MTETRGLFTQAMSPVPPEDFAWPGYAEYAERFHLTDAGHIVLFAGDDPVGSIGFGLSNGRKLKPSDRAFIEGVARQAAIAIRMADLAEGATLAAVAHEREAAAQEHVAKLARTNHALKQTLDVVASEPDFGQVPGKLLEAIATELQSPSAALKLFNKKSGRFEIHLVYHEGKVIEVNNDTVPLLKGVWGRGRDLLLKVHTRERRPVVYQVGELERSNPQAFRFFDQLGVRSLLGVPLLLGSEILGSLSIRFNTLRELTPDELELTQAMAHQATLAMQLTSLAARAGEAALIEERMRFARDVHDTLAQGFTGILMQLGAASQVKEESITAIEPQLEAIEALARSSLAEARRAVRSLRFLPSEEEMLERAVEQIINRARTQTNAEIGLEITGCPHSPGSRVNSELTLIIQESIHNAIKHAAAKRIIVSLEFQRENALRVSVKDDGIGFDTSSVPVDRFGLMGMHERAESIGASLTIVSEKSRGARIVVQYGRTGN
jgi:signal transduction histidine kinase